MEAMNRGDYENLLNEFQQINDPTTTLNTLCSYITWAIEELRPEDDIARKFIQILEQNNPVEWCHLKELQLDSAVKVSIIDSYSDRGIKWKAKPLAAYCLGRAAMKQALLFPENTEGLTRPFKMLEIVDSYGICYEGISDELSLENLSIDSQPIKEVKREVVSLRSKLLENDANERLKMILTGESESKSVEEAINTSHEEVFFHLWIHLVILSIAINDPEKAVELLESIESPTLQSAILVDSKRASIDVLLKLIPKCKPVFSNRGEWTKQTLGRILINAIEDRLFFEFDNRTTNQSDADKTSSQKKHIQDLQLTLKGRVDGSWLALEWIFHLMDRTIRQPVARSTDNYRKILDLALDCFVTENWAMPQQLFDKLSNSNFSKSIEDLELKNLPVWLNSRGENDLLTPFAVSVGFVMGNSDFTKHAQLFLLWFRTIFRFPTGQPHLVLMSVHPSEVLLSLLSWVVVHADNPKVFLSELWNRATESRLKARFFRSGDSFDHSYHTLAVLRIGISVIGWIEDLEFDFKDLPHLLADQLDEIRYCLPPIGYMSWSPLISDVIAMLSVSELLLKENGSANILHRYKGDDDALVSALVAAERNGIPIKALSDTLTELEENPAMLRDRWKQWNESYGRYQSSTTHEILDLLLRISN